MPDRAPLAAAGDDDDLVFQLHCLEPHEQFLEADLAGTCERTLICPSVYDGLYARSHKLSVEAAKNARELLLKEYRAVLPPTRRNGRAPFGSVVPYCLDAEGRPLILISRIAQHTHNLQADPRCSMLVGERGAEDIQAVGRLTLLAEARQLAEEEVAAAAERYYRYFPESADYHRVHDFDFCAAAGPVAFHRRFRRDPLAGRRARAAGQSVRRRSRARHGRAHEQRPRRRHRPIMWNWLDCRRMPRRSWRELIQKKRRP